MGKLFLYFNICVIILNTSAYAQHEYPKCEYRYFKNKKVSTSLCYDENRRWGKAKAFNGNGELIYEKDLRLIGGSSSVEFFYYDNGAVQKAKWHSAPDAGIQWYNTTTYFSPDGKIEKEEHNNYDDLTHMHTSPIRPSSPTYPEPKPKQEVATCGAIYSTEFWYINKTNNSLQVQAIRKGNIKDVVTTIISPGDTVKGGNFIMAEQFVDIEDYYDFKASYSGRKKQHVHNLVFYQLPPKVIRKDVKRFYYVIR